MDYSKLADEFIEEGAWQGSPVIAVSMFAKWLEEREAAQQTFAPDVCHGTADGRHLFQNDNNGRYCFACGTRR